MFSKALLGWTGGSECTAYRTLRERASECTAPGEGDIGRLEREHAYSTLGRSMGRGAWGGGSECTAPFACLTSRWGWGSLHPMFAPAAGWQGQNCAVIRIACGACSDHLCQLINGWYSPLSSIPCPSLPLRLITHAPCALPHTLGAIHPAIFPATLTPNMLFTHALCALPHTLGAIHLTHALRAVAGSHSRPAF